MRQGRFEICASVREICETQDVEALPRETEQYCVACGIQNKVLEAEFKLDQIGSLWLIRDETRCFFSGIAV